MTQDTDANPIFPIILASTVHDIKSSLVTLLGLIQALAVKQPDWQPTEIRQLEFEAGRINHSLMQLLAMYRIDSQKFQLVVDEYAAIDLIREAKVQQDRLAELTGVQVQVDCDEELYCFCDYQHVGNALGTILNNAQRYTHHIVRLSAVDSDGYIRFCIEDDGDGYPEHLLNADLSNLQNLDWVNGNTGLGLYFAAAIAGFHKNSDKTGFVTIDNHSRLGGARFCLYLP